MLQHTRFCSLYRLLQLGLALIPTAIGILAFLNDIGTFHSGVQNTIIPLISMQGDTGYTWRALPASWAPIVYTLMFLCEFLVGILALIGVLSMLRHFFSAADLFERSKQWVYIACLWGSIVWGLGFFEGGGDWFLAWMSTNNNISGLQQGGFMYAALLFIVFVYLKYCRE